jgi:flagellar hook-associated protein 3 FlgL
MEVTLVGADYHLSIDGGITTVKVPVGGDANTAVTDSRTGKTLFVDTTGITGEGTVTANVQGTHDVFNLLIDIRNLLMSTADVKEELAAVASSLSTVHKKLVNGFALIGGRSSTLGIMMDGYENVQFNSKEEIARLQDADIAQIAVDLTRRETLYQMSMGIAGKLLSTSLMDFLR